ncbi:hypothetical protein NE865_11507 [Phthorimaea operculella]|nr:hypothetical protein NE865_11507 [Phthorimaea operculella]
MDHPQIGIGRAALLARLLNHVTCNLRGTINLDETVYAWTDSRIVLCWLQTSVHTLEVFVANRVSQITGSETPLVWRHVPGEWNPADCASRGCRAPDLVSHPLWWGPQWLTESPQEWPFNECRAPLGPPDRGLRVNVGQLVPKPNPAFLLERYSSLDKLLGVTGWIKRFVNNCRKPQAERNFAPVLSPAERNAALCSLVRVVQAEHFEEENSSLRCIMFHTFGQRAAKAMSTCTFCSNALSGRTGLNPPALVISFWLRMPTYRHCVGAGGAFSTCFRVVMALLELQKFRWGIQSLSEQ